jgi:hypothetical protein
MADSWYDWLQGSPDQRQNDLEAQKKQLEAIRASQVDQRLKAMGDTPVYTPGGGYDPRELRMAAVQDQLTPERTSDASQAVGSTVNYGLDFGGRMRDTAFTAAAEAARGNNLKAAELLARSVGAGAVPALGAGMRGQPDDWRRIAADNGVSPSAVMAYDLATDPENWVTAPVRAPLHMMIPGVGWRMANAAGRYGDDVLRAVNRAADAAQYGHGAPTYLIDDAGEVIRRLRSSPAN